MPDVIAPATRAPREPRNGVNTPDLLATINAVKETPHLAKFRFRASNRWMTAPTASRASSRSAARAANTRTRRSSATAPTIRPCWSGRIAGRPRSNSFCTGSPSCITAGIGNIAAVRGVTLTSVESRVEGDIDLRGILGLSDEVRNGYERIRITFDIAGDAPPEKLREIVEQSRAPLRGLRRAHQRRAGRRQHQRSLRRIVRRTTTVIIGAGQAGLAMSHCLSELGIDHVVIERGKLAQRWRSQSWDSLRLLTPNWMTRLPGFQYDGDDPRRLHVGPRADRVLRTLRSQFAATAAHRDDRAAR